MKNTSQIIGLPVVDLSTGTQLGTIYDLIINDDKGSVDYFLLDNGFILLGAKVIDAKDIKGIGEYALTVAKKEAVRDILRVDAAVNLYKKKIRVKNTKVLTQKGKLIGETGDIYISEKDFLISAVEFIPFSKKDKVRIIPRKGIVTFGENLVVVIDDFKDVTDVESSEYTDVSPIEDQKSKAPEQHEIKDEEIMYKEPAESKTVDMVRVPTKHSESRSLPKKEQIEKKPVPSEAQNIEQQVAVPKARTDRQEEKVKEQPLAHRPDGDLSEPENIVFEEGISAKNVYYRPGVKQYEIHKKQAAETLKKEQPKSSELFEIKQREYLMGRKVTKEIKDKMGNSILNTGDLITEDAMNRAKESGKFIELVMNNRP